MTQPLRFPRYALFFVMLLLLPGRAAAQSATLADDAFLSSNTATQLANANGQGVALVVAGSNATVGPVHVGTTKSFIKFQLQSSLPPSAAAANDRLDGVRIVGAQPFATFRAAVEGLLKMEVALKN